MADRRLKVFHTVAKLLSFTKAAESLHMTQPAVTFQVRQLEEYFNIRLFDRTHNRISLTEAGADVQKYADKIFEAYDELDNSVKAMIGDISGSLTIGASTTIAEYMLPTLLWDFKLKYPDVAIHLKVSNTKGIVSMVENNTIDLGVVEAPVGNKNLVVEVCLPNQLVAIVPPEHPEAQRENLTYEDLVKYPFICREEGSGTREMINEFMTQGSQGGPDDLKMAMELGSPEAVKGAVEAGMGISIVSRATIQKELRLGTLVAIDLEPPLERSVSFVHQKQKFRARIMEELRYFALQYCEKHKTILEI